MAWLGRGGAYGGTGAQIDPESGATGVVGRKTAAVRRLWQAAPGLFRSCTSIVSLGARKTLCTVTYPVPVGQESWERGKGAKGPEAPRLLTSLCSMVQSGSVLPASDSLHAGCVPSGMGVLMPWLWKGGACTTSYLSFPGSGNSQDCALCNHLCTAVTVK